MPEDHKFHDAVLLTKQELADRLKADSTRLVDELVACGKIPVIRLGHRTVRFNWGHVCAALESMTVWPNRPKREWR
jgi:hypothetical protein